MNTLRAWARDHLGPAVPPLKKLERIIKSRFGRNEHIARQNKMAGLNDSPVKVLAPETYSQFAEDLLVMALLRARLWSQGRNIDSIFYVDIGANHPISTSNSFLFYKFGAHGILVEANPELIPDLQRVRARDKVFATAISTTREQTLTLHIGNAHELSSVKADHAANFGDFRGLGGVAKKVVVKNTHINDFLDKNVPSDFDILSIDCEGIDYELLCAIDFDKVRPFVVLCEPSENFIPGNTARMVTAMKKYSYQLAAITDANLIFTRA